MLCPEKREVSNEESGRQFYARRTTPRQANVTSTFQSLMTLLFLGMVGRGFAMVCLSRVMADESIPDDSAA